MDTMNQIVAGNIRRLRKEKKLTMEELAKNEEAVKIAATAFKLTMNMTVKPGEGMWDMMKSMTLEKVGEMAGSLAPEGFMESINAQLNKIKKD